MPNDGKMEKITKSEILVFSLILVNLFLFGTLVLLSDSPEVSSPGNCASWHGLNGTEAVPVDCIMGEDE